MFFQTLLAIVSSFDTAFKAKVVSLNNVVQGKLQFSFAGSVCDRIDRRRVLIEIDGDGDKSCLETSNALTERFYGKGHGSVVLYLVFVNVSSQTDLGWCGLTQGVPLVLIPASVEDLCEYCFVGCKRVSRGTGSESSSLT